jgi:hypothetical protein
LEDQTDSDGPAPPSGAADSSSGVTSASHETQRVFQTPDFHPRPATNTSAATVSSSLRSNESTPSQRKLRLADSPRTRKVIELSQGQRLAEVRTRRATGQQHLAVTTVAYNTKIAEGGRPRKSTGSAGLQPPTDDSKKRRLQREQWIELRAMFSASEIRTKLLFISPYTIAYCDVTFFHFLYFFSGCFVSWMPFTNHTRRAYVLRIRGICFSFPRNTSIFLHEIEKLDGGDFVAELLKAKSK